MKKSKHHTKPSSKSFYTKIEHFKKKGKKKGIYYQKKNQRVKIHILRKHQGSEIWFLLLLLSKERNLSEKSQLKASHQKTLQISEQYPMFKKKHDKNKGMKTEARTPAEKESRSHPKCEYQDFRWKSCDRKNNFDV